MLGRKYVTDNIELGLLRQFNGIVNIVILVALDMAVHDIEDGAGWGCNIYRI